MNDITWSLKTFQIDELTDYSKNPRSLTKQQFEQLKKSLDKFGLIDKPIINADEKHTVIGGHQRLRVLRSENQKSVECWYPSRELDEKEVEELNIRLNKNTGDWDFDTLANNFEVGDLMDWGFTEMDLGIYPEDEEEGAEEEEVLRPKNFMRILISVPVNSAIEVKDTIESLSDIPGIEIDYGAN